MKGLNWKAGLCPGLMAAALLAGAVSPVSAAVTVTRLVPAQPSQVSPEQVSVLVFFDFKPASQALFRSLNAWAANAGHRLVLDREPVVGSGAAPLARAFVVARTLGVTASVLPALFRLAAATPAQKQPSGSPPLSESAIAGIFNSIGINAIEFKAAWNSPATAEGMLRARAMVGRFQTNAAPVLIVNGLWRIAPGAGATPDEMIAALEQQIETLVTRTAAK